LLEEAGSSLSYQKRRRKEKRKGTKYGITQDLEATRKTEEAEQQQRYGRLPETHRERRGSDARKA
jgi:hypothetical protein